MTTYYTAEQAQRILKQIAGHKVLPEKGERVTVECSKTWKGKCTVTLHDMKSTHGRPLYKFVFNGVPLPS